MFLATVIFLPFSCIHYCTRFQSLNFLSSKSECQEEKPLGSCPWSCANSVQNLYRLLDLLKCECNLIDLLLVYFFFKLEGLSEFEGELNSNCKCWKCDPKLLLLKKVRNELRWWQHFRFDRIDAIGFPVFEKWLLWNAFHSLIYAVSIYWAPTTWDRGL